MKSPRTGTRVYGSGGKKASKEAFKMHHGASKQCQ